MSTVYESITERIIKQLEAGVIPWRKEWKNTGSGLPYNLVSNLPYRGVNIISLLCSGFASNGWCTYKQAQALGYQVRKGEKAAPVVFWKFPTKGEAGQDEKSYRPFARTYSVFNLDQLDGVPAADPAADAPVFDAIADAEKIVSDFMGSASHPTLAHGGNRAFFRPITDHVQMPEKTSFLTPAGYYATLFHEFAHSTGTKGRLNRDELAAYAAFGDENYSKEELTAEFTSAFLCAQAGISSDERTASAAAYIQGWLSELKNDKTLAMQAAQRAQKAADFILLRSLGAAAVSDDEVAA
jgi:antirestriction protein ArdC